MVGTMITHSNNTDSRRNFQSNLCSSVDLRTQIMALLSN